MKIAPTFDPETLAAYASLATGRHITMSDPEVAEYQEAFDAQTFIGGGRTSSGYYLNVVIVTMSETYNDDGSLRTPGVVAQLASPNDLMRPNLKVSYKSKRNDLFYLLSRQISPEQLPRRPLEAARVLIRIFVRRTQKQWLDAEAKYSACKPLIDCLTPPKVFKGSGKAVTQAGLGILLDDTDGEHDGVGVIRQMTVQQVHTKLQPRLQLVIEEVV